MIDDSLKAYVVLWSIHTISLDKESDVGDDMWQLYYSLSKEEIESTIQVLQMEGLVRIKSVKSGNRIYPTLVLTDKGKEFLDQKFKQINKVEEFNLERLGKVLTGIIGFLNAWQQNKGDDIELFQMIDSLDMASYKRQAVIDYINTYGNVYVFCNNKKYLDDFCIQTIEYLRDFLGELPEVEAAIFRCIYNFNTDPFYRDMFQIMEYYQINYEDILSYNKETLKKYQSSQWYDGCIWVKRIVDCFFRNSFKYMPLSYSISSRI